MVLARVRFPRRLHMEKWIKGIPKILVTQGFVLVGKEKVFICKNISEFCRNHIHEELLFKVVKNFAESVQVVPKVLNFHLIDGDIDEILYQVEYKWITGLEVNFTTTKVISPICGFRVKLK